MKRDWITKKQAEELNLVYTGICFCVDKNEKNKKEVVNTAAKEEKETGIPCYPVMGEGNMTVYAEPVYMERSNYYRNKNKIEQAYENVMRKGREFAEAMSIYDSLNFEVERLARELKEAGIKF